MKMLILRAVLAFKQRRYRRLGLFIACAETEQLRLIEECNDLQRILSRSDMNQGYAARPVSR